MLENSFSQLDYIFFITVLWEKYEKRNTILEFDAVSGGDYPVVVYQRSATDVREGASACLVVEGGLPRPLPSSRVHAVHDPILRVSGQTGSCKTIFNQSIWLVLTYFIDFIVRIKSWRFPLFSLSLSRLSKITWRKIAMELDMSVWYSPCYKHFVIYIYCSNKLFNVISIIRFL